MELGDEYIYAYPGRVPARGVVKAKTETSCLFKWNPPVIKEIQKLPLAKWFFKIPKGEENE